MNRFMPSLPSAPCAGKQKNIGLQQLDKDPFIVKRGESQQQTIEAWPDCRFRTANCVRVHGTGDKKSR